MEDFKENSINKASINVSRNSPTALVVGAAGFIGSHLSEKLLDHKITVIGVDNFKSGKRENITELAKSSHFHFINSDAENLILDLPRLDYIFIVAGEGWGVSKILSLAKEYKAKIIFISWIDLYDHKSNFGWFKKIEGELADFAKEHHLNARVLRLSPVYGPRMNLEVSDPIISLITASLNDKLQEESTTMDFSTRALYITDATTLIIKSLFSGSTSWKIFDGVSPSPIKVSEVKQVLMDPIWHDQRGFTPSELPPWPTPNLERTQKELHWQPKMDLVKSLKETINYFKEHDFSPPQKLEENLFIKKDVEEDSEKEKPAVIEEEKKDKKKRGVKMPKIPVARLIILTIFFYAFIYPLMVLGLGLTFLNIQINSSLESLKRGEFEKSLSNARRGKEVALQIKDAISPFLVIGNSIIPTQTQQINEKFTSLNQTIVGSEHLILGTENLFLSFKSVSGEKTGESGKYFEMASIEFQAAEQVLLPISISSNDERIKYLTTQATKNRSLAKSMPVFVSDDKNYLVLLQDSTELRPTGGVIAAVGLLSFSDGKLKSIEVETPGSIDSKIKTKVAPPKFLTEDMGKTNWDFKDTNWEPDFPTGAARVISFYNQVNPVKIDGVITLDLQAAKDLLLATGELSLAGRERVSADNLISQATINQGEELFLANFTKELLNRIFFGSDKIVIQTLESLENSLSKKHILIFVTDSKLSAFLQSGNISGKIPRPSSVDGDILAFSEANMGSNKANHFIDKNLSLEITNVNGGLNHRLQVNFVNRSPNDVWPGGTLKNRIRVFVPYGSKLISLKYGETDITQRVTTVVDYGRSVYEFLIDVGPKEAKSLSLNYQTIDFKSLYLVKQPGTNEDLIQLNLPNGQSYSQKFENDLEIDLK